MPTHRWTDAGMSNSGTKEPSPQSSAAQSPEEPQRRGRGRPRKQQQEPVGPPTPKRPRGRPKGSKNKAPRTALKFLFSVGRGRSRDFYLRMVKMFQNQNRFIAIVSEQTIHKLGTCFGTNVLHIT
uniref:Uncharacterized protein n=1 Tax=Nothobranchius furzeri TaxID=105023 RepID=A0A8C6P314_NOTFU